MKSIVLCLSAIVLLAAGCSKTSTTTGRDAFVGNYTMHDTIIHENNGGGGTTIFDTVHENYTLVVLPVSGTTDRVAFNNLNNAGYSDTGIVSGNVVSFVSYDPTASTATLTGNKLSVAGGFRYTTETYVGGYATIYASGVGTKQ